LIIEKNKKENKMETKTTQKKSVQEQIDAINNAIHIVANQVDFNKVYLDNTEMTDIIHTLIQTRDKLISQLESEKPKKILFITKDTKVDFETISPDKITNTSIRGKKYNAILVDSGIVLYGMQLPLVSSCLIKSDIKEIK
jgi:hypothetical protein